MEYIINDDGQSLTGIPFEVTTLMSDKVKLFFYNVNFEENNGETTFKASMRIRPTINLDEPTTFVKFYFELHSWASGFGHKISCDSKIPHRFIVGLFNVLPCTNLDDLQKSFAKFAAKIPSSADDKSAENHRRSTYDKQMCISFLDISVEDEKDIQQTATIAAVHTTSNAEKYFIDTL